MADMSRNILASQCHGFAFFGFKYVLSPLGLHAAFHLLLMAVFMTGVVSHLAGLAILISLAALAHGVSLAGLRRAALLAGAIHSRGRLLRALPSSTRRHLSDGRSHAESTSYHNRKRKLLHCHSPCF